MGVASLIPCGLGVVITIIVSIILNVRALRSSDPKDANQPRWKPLVGLGLTALSTLVWGWLFLAYGLNR